MANYALSPRRYARMIKRALRLLSGQDILYRYDVHPPKKHLGTIYGGWTIVPELLGSSSVVYSVGVGHDISFDLELIRRFGVTVHGFDPSPQAIEWFATQNLPANYIFHPWGLSAIDGTVNFFTPPSGSGSMSLLRKGHMKNELTQTQVTAYRLSTIAKSLGTKEIDLLKIDVEGTEYDLIPDLIESPVPIKQLMIEFHHRIGVESLATTVRSVNRLRNAGFQLFHVSETSSELSFLHK
jgi:FkbM family methyltransferase